LIVPVPPGGGVDILSRAIGQKMSQSMGVPVVVENKAGASAVIGTELLAKSPPDGYTIMMGYSAHATNPIFNTKLPYDTNKDFAAIAHVGYIPLILVVPPSFPANSVKELIALAKAKPGQLQFASGGAGAGAHLSGELLKATAGVDLIHVPYKGNAPALTDVLGGQVPMMFDTITTSLPHVKAGKLKALAVTSAKRSPLAPDVPTMIEAGLPDFEISAWYVMFAPAGTPRDVMQRLNAEINKAINDPELRRSLGEQGVEFTGGTPEQADAFVHNEIERWGRIIKTRGMSGN
ncbi:MAG TPA: tripartite tricarboxylate transporter substrate binding protein, partial [Casimicrobiaceae bacterium]|nr:tripartite tricarboxylate transporter substrate binding protein [Casimicrobiaceae bacterium]